MKIDEITKKIIGCAYTVTNELGHGFLGKAHENALTHEIRKTGLTIEQQCPIPVMYDGTVTLVILVSRLGVSSAVNDCCSCAPVRAWNPK